MDHKDTRAKALELAIILTKADHTALTMDRQGKIHVKEPLYSTYLATLKFLSTENNLSRAVEAAPLPVP